MLRIIYKNLSAQISPRSQLQILFYYTIVQEVPNNEAIWAEIASEEQREHGVQQFADAWSSELLKAEEDGLLLPDELNDHFDLENSKHAYSKVRNNIYTL